MDTATIIAMATLAVSIIGGYTFLVYKLGVVMSQLNHNTALILEVREIVVDDKKRIEELEARMLVIETQHKINHGGM